MSKRRNIILFTAISLILLLLFCADILLGSSDITLSGVWAALTGEAAPTDDVFKIVFRFRLPKALVAVAAGAALSASGLQMQTLFRNPLAGPFVLGISSGASLGVAVFLLGMPLLGISSAADIVRDVGMAGSALIGSALIFAMISAVSSRIKDIMTILILGMMFGSVAGAFVEILQYFSPEGALKTYVIWTMGSLGGVSGQQLWIILALVIVGLGISVLLIKPLNMLLLGENYARSMGMKANLSRIMIFVSTTLLAGGVTAFCGPIGFIGIAVPHIARMIFATADHRTLMPASMLLGSALLLLCDIIAQMPGYDMVLPINTVTALLGIPVVVIVIIRNRKIF